MKNKKVFQSLIDLQALLSEEEKKKVTAENEANEKRWLEADKYIKEINAKLQVK